MAEPGLQPWRSATNLVSFLTWQLFFSDAEKTSMGVGGVRDKELIESTSRLSISPSSRPSLGRRNHTLGCTFILFGDYPLSRGKFYLTQILQRFLYLSLFNKYLKPRSPAVNMTAKSLLCWSSCLPSCGAHWEAEWLCLIFWLLKSRKCLQGTKSNTGDRDPLYLFSCWLYVTNHPRLSDV